MSISVHDYAELLLAFTFHYDDLHVGEVRTGKGDETELLVFDHVNPAAAGKALDAYTMFQSGLPLRQLCPTGWRIEHTWAVLDYDAEDGLTVQLFPQQPTQEGTGAFPVTRWTDREPS